MLKAESFGFAVVARIADMFADETPWTQRQWRSGTLDALRHVQALVANGGRDAAKSWALTQLRAQVSTDPFIPPKERGAMLKPLNVKPDKLAPASHAARMLDELEQKLAADYWDWVVEYCRTIDDSEPVASAAASADTIAWRLAAHFRSSGLSDGWIVNFANFHMKFEAELHALADVVESAKRTAQSGSGWTFLVPLLSRRGFNIASNGAFLTPTKFEEQFSNLFPETDVPFNYGGLCFFVNTVDKYAAIEGMRRSLSRLLERHAATTTRRKLVPGPTAWVDPGRWSPTKASRSPFLAASTASRTVASRMSLSGIPREK